MSPAIRRTSTGVQGTRVGACSELTVPSYERVRASRRAASSLIGEGAHADVEWIDIASVEQCVEIHLKVAPNLCS